MYQTGRAWTPQQQMSSPPRLPPGWEAKWDPNNGRWFYVDHRTKTTHWVPPDASAWQQQSTQPQHVTTSFITADPEKVKALMSEYEGVSTETVGSMLRVHQNHIDAVRKDLSNKGYRKKVPPVEPNMHFVNSLKGRYPSASEDVIKEVLVSTQNSYAGARLSLEAMGYQMKPASTGGVSNDDVLAIVGEYNGVSTDYIESMLRVYGNNVGAVKKNLDEKGYKRKKSVVVPNPRLVTALRQNYEAASEDVIKQVLSNTSNNLARASTSLEAMGYKKRSDLRSASKTHAPKKAKSATTTTSDDLSEEDKKSMLHKLKKRFPTVAESVVKLSLVGTMYDIEMAASILKSSLETVKSKSSTSVTSSADTRARPSEETSTEPTEFKPSTTSLTPVIFGAEEKTEPPPEPVIQSSFTSISSTIVDPPSSKKSEPAYKKRDYFTQARKVYARPNAPVTGYVSSNRCKPAGPNPVLVSGPNPALLQTQLIKAAGPNSANRAGPQKFNRCGPVASNARGRAGIDVGPMQGRLLMTSI